MLLAHWHFFATLHGGGGIVRGLNALFQLLGNGFAIFAAIAIVVAAVFGKLTLFTGAFSALLLGFVGFYCLSKAFAMMVGV